MREFVEELEFELFGAFESSIGDGRREPDFHGRVPRRAEQEERVGVGYFDESEARNGVVMRVGELMNATVVVHVVDVDRVVPAREKEKCLREFVVCCGRWEGGFACS